MRLKIISFLACGLFSCRFRSEPETEVKGVVTEDYEAALFVDDQFHSLSTGAANPCGMDESAVKVFNKNLDRNFFLSKDLFLMPPSGRALSSAYAVQVVPPESLAVGGTTPLIRLIPQADLTGQNIFSPTTRSTHCKINKQNALIFLYGVASADWGTRISTMDYNMIWGLLNFELQPNTPPPSGDGKIASLPGYIQLVPNANTSAGGISGPHDMAAAKMFENNLKLAYQGGIKDLDIVTHSNGMITSHMGYTSFVYDNFRDGSARSAIVAARKKSLGLKESDAVPPMNLKFFHLQAAPDEFWTSNEKGPNPPGTYTDFVPIFQQKAKFLGGIFGFPAAEYTANFMNQSDLLTWSFKWYYNKADFLTYPSASGFSTVGIYESIQWIRMAAPLRDSLDKFSFGHYFCDVDSNNQTCGHKHGAFQALIDVAEPGLITVKEWANYEQ